jgi:hypothetical protein
MGVATAILLGNQLIISHTVEARDHNEGQRGGGAQPNRGGGGGGGEGRAAQAQAQSAREQQVRQQEDQARQQQESMRRQQEEQGRQQQEQQRQQQDQSRRQQEQAQRQQEQNQRQQQQEVAKQQERQQEQVAKQQQRQQEQVQKEQQRQQEQAAKEERNQQEQGNRNQQETNRREQETAQRQEQENRHAVAPGTTAMLRESRPAERGNFGGSRASAPRPLTNIRSLPINKAVSMPVVDPHWTQEEREHATVVSQNLQTHLYPFAQPPANYQQIASENLNSYINNYPCYIGNQQCIINRENTFVNPFPAYQYPYWYQPQPGWIFSNGFTLGNLVHVPLDWLGFGWHPYYGPQPEGFVCSSSFVPTPWIYVPAYGLWRLAGMEGYAQSGPPYDYSGPITVETLEPRHVNIRDPYTGYETRRVVNVMYLYNAFYYPEYERYGYTNRHGYFILLNL